MQGIRVRVNIRTEMQGNRVRVKYKDENARE